MGGEGSVRLQKTIIDSVPDKEKHNALNKISFLNLGLYGKFFCIYYTYLIFCSVFLTLIKN